jgi:hypothetical protein
VTAFLSYFREQIVASSAPITLPLNAANAKQYFTAVKIVKKVTGIFTKSFAPLCHFQLLRSRESIYTTINKFILITKSIPKKIS